MFQINGRIMKCESGRPGFILRREIWDFVINVLSFTTQVCGSVSRLQSRFTEELRTKTIASVDIQGDCVETEDITHHCYPSQEMIEQQKFAPTTDA